MKLFKVKRRVITHLPQERPVITDHYEMENNSNYAETATAKAVVSWNVGGRYKWTVEYCSDHWNKSGRRCGHGTAHGDSPSMEYAFMDMCEIIGLTMGEKTEFERGAFKNELDQYVRLGNEYYDD